MNARHVLKDCDPFAVGFLLGRNQGYRCAKPRLMAYTTLNELLYERK